MVIAVDFDGTCVVTLPTLGWSETDTGADKVLKRLTDEGHQIVLWTCRNHSGLNPYNYLHGEYRDVDSQDEAEAWFSSHGIPLISVNEVPGEEDIIGETRKILYDLLIDDTSLGMRMLEGEVEYVDYQTGEIKKALGRCVDWGWIESELERTGVLRRRT